MTVTALVLLATLAAQSTRVDDAIQKGAAANSQREYDSQKRIFEEILPEARLLDHRLSEVLNGLGAAEMRLGQPGAARKALEEAIKIAVRKQTLIDEADARTNLGMLNCQTGDCMSAIREYESALRCWRELARRGEPDPVGQAVTGNNYAQALSQLGRLEAAAREYASQAAAFARLNDAGRQKVALTNLAGVEVKLGRALQALRTIERAANLPGTAASDGDVHHARARAYELLGRLDEAGASVSAAIKAYEKSPSRLAVAEHTRGMIAARRGQHAGAIDAFATARRLRDGVQSAGAADSLAMQAESELALGRHQLALEHIKQAVAEVEAIRARVAADQLRSSFLASKQQYYDTWIRAELALSNPKAALEVAERARARSLLDLLAEQRADVRRGAPKALLDRERALIERMSLLDAQASLAVEPRRSALRRELDGLTEELSRLENEIKRSSKIFASLAPETTVKVDELGALLGNNTTLVEFWQGRSGGFAFYTSRGAVTVRPVDGKVFQAGKDLSKALQAAANGAQGGSIPPLDGARAAKLRELLPGGRERLAIVPDASLDRVPWALLAGTERETIVLPSASILRLLRARPNRKYEKELAALGDPIYEPSDSDLKPAAGYRVPPPPVALARLGRSQELIKNLLDLAELKQRSTPFLRAQASKSWLSMPVSAQYRTLLLSMHARAESRGAAAFIAFTFYDAAGRLQPGLLRTAELYSMNLASDLVILSACETAAGEVVPGEGVMSLTRGILQAGPRAVISTLWKVDETATTELMKKFFALLYSGSKNGGPVMTPASALRQAQHWMATSNETTRFHHPYYWAGFILQGDWR